MIVGFKKFFIYNFTVSCYSSKSTKLYKKRAIILFLLLLTPVFVFSQELKLGIPDGHKEQINSFRFSPDGQFLLTSSSDNTAKVYEVSSGALVYSLDDHSASVYSAEFSPDGSKIVTASFDGSAKIYELATGKIIHTLIDGSSSLNHAKFSPDGSMVITANSKLNVYNVSSGQLIQTIEVPNTRIGARRDIKTAIYSPDGKNILLLDDEGAVSILNASTGELLYNLSKHINFVTFMQLSPGGDQVAIGGLYGDVKLIDLSTGKLVHTLKKHENTVSGIKFSLDGNSVLTSGGYGSYNISSVGTGKIVRSIEDEEIKAMDLSADGASFIIGRGAEIRVISVSTGSGLDAFKMDTPTERELKEYYDGHSDPPYINHLEFSRDGKYQLIESSLGYVVIRPLASGEKVHKLTNQLARLSKVVFSPDGAKIAGIIEGKIHLLDSKTGMLLSSIEANLGNRLSVLQFSPDGKSILATANSVIKIFNVSTASLFQTYEIDRPVMATQFSPDGKYIVVGTRFGYIRIIELLTDKVVSFFDVSPYHVVSVDFSFNGRSIVVADNDDKITVFNLDGTIFKELDAGSSIGSVQFSKDGNSILVGLTYQGLAKIVDISSGKLIQSLNAIKRELLLSTRFSPDGKNVLTAADKTAIIYEVASGQVLFTLDGHNSNVNKAIYSPNGKFILTSSSEGSQILFGAQTGEELIRYFILDRDTSKWVHLHPSGLFDASPEAMEMLYWTKGLEVIDFDNWKDRYWKPGLWEKVITGEFKPNDR